MKTTISHPTPIRWLCLWFVVVLLGCNLGTSSESAPPTLVPRSSATPPPTLGFNGQTSNNNIALGGVGTPAHEVVVDLYNITQQVDTERLMAHVRALEGFYTRHVNSIQTSQINGIGAARNYIFQQFQQTQQASGGRFTAILQEFDLTYNEIPTRQANVVGVLQGTEPGAGFIVVGAHYDSINTDFSDASGFAPGSNDNATGVSAIIEIARILSQQQYRSSIIFVAFSAEEVNRRGSRAFVNWAIERNIDIVGMVNIDTIGNNNNRAGQVDNSLRIFSCLTESNCSDAGKSRQLARTAEFLGFQQNAPLEMKVEPTADREGRYGDHFSFSERGYPAIRFINTLEEFPNGSQQDVIASVEPEYFRNTTQSILVVILALADGPQPPRNVTLRNADNGQRTLVWEPVEGASRYMVALRWPGSPRYDQFLEWSTTSITWDSFGSYAGIAVAAIGADGVFGRLSQEYAVQPGQ